MASSQSEVRALLESWSEAARIKDIDRLMSLYSPDITYFDVVPPLRYTGSAAVRGNFLRWFDGFKSSIGQEIRDLNILASGDIAAAYMLRGIVKSCGLVSLITQRPSPRFLLPVFHFRISPRPSPVPPGERRSVSSTSLRRPPSA